jgi:putative DNA primase/helicase
MKQLTGGESVKARRMRQDFFDMPPTWKIFLAANHKPVVRGCDLAVWRRIKLLPFTVTIPEEEKDKHLPEKLKAEWPGILAWAVRGCLDWQRDGLGEPDEVRQATVEYQAEQDTLAGFINACCVLHREARVKAADLLGAYARWSGERDLAPRTFNSRVQEKGYASKRETAGYYYRGIGLFGSANEPK